MIQRNYMQWCRREELDEQRGTNFFVVLLYEMKYVSYLYSNRLTYSPGLCFNIASRMLRLSSCKKKGGDEGHEILIRTHYNYTLKRIKRNIYCQYIHKKRKYA